MSERERARRARFRVFMQTYYAARMADLAALEDATALYAAEVAEYLTTRPPITFKGYLVASRGCPR